MKFWLVDTPPHSAWIVVQRTSEGPWIRQPTALEEIPRPVRYSCVRDGVFGAVLGDEANGILFRADLVDAMSRFEVVGFQAVPARIERMRDKREWTEYSLVHVHRALPRSLLGAPAAAALALGTSRHLLFRIEDIPNVFVVNDHLRLDLEQSGIPDLHFSEPVFFGGPS